MKMYSNMNVLIVAICCLQAVIFAAPSTTMNNGQANACDNKVTDVIFVLPAARTIAPRDFAAEKKFTQDIIAKLDIHDTKTRVGLISYSDYVQEIFGLKTYLGRKSLIMGDVETRFYQQGRGTYIDRALLHAREMTRVEGRNNVPRIVILLTDNRSQYPRETFEEARRTTNSKITIFAVGIGNNVDKSELGRIASRKDTVLTVKSYDELYAINDDLVNKICGATNNQADSPYYGGYHSYNNYRQYQPRYRENEVMKPTEKKYKLEKTCGGRPAEIVFCLDASGSIWGPDFRKQIEFVREMSSVFQVAPNMTRVGVLTYSDRPMKWFKLSQHKFEEEVDQAISQIQQIRGGTNTAEALSTMRRDYFSPSETRQGVVKIAIVITDGKSSNRAATVAAAQKLKEEDIHVFAIGVGHQLDEEELYLIASHPKEYVFKVDNYAALETIKKVLSWKTCQVTLPPTTTEPITGCGDRRPADLVFAMPPDANAAQAAKILSMMGKLRDELEMGEDAVRMGLVPKECVSLPGLELSAELDTDELMKEMEKSFAAAHTPRIIRYLRKKSFANGKSRKEAQKMAIIVLDKSAPNYKQAAAEAYKAKQMGMEIFVVAIGNDITDAELKLIVSPPMKDHVVRVQSYAELEDVVPDLVDLINKACIEFIPPELESDEKDTSDEDQSNTIQIRRNRMDLFNRRS